MQWNSGDSTPYCPVQLLGSTSIDTVVAGNYIGLDVNGDTLGSDHVGMAIMMGAHDNTIGRNSIAYNGTARIAVVDLRAHVEGNRMLENSIQSNESV